MYQNLLERAKIIVESYKFLPPEEIVMDSMVNELANLIVDYVMIRGEHISDFDFDNLFKELKLPKE